MAEGRKTLVIRQVRGSAGKTERQIRILRALGLRRTGHTTEKEDTPNIRGMLAKVSHLVEVVEK